MIKRIALALLGLSAGVVNPAPNQWPQLPRAGFIAGRVANEADVKRGDAVFFVRTDSQMSGKPLAIRIPQFAYLKNEIGARIPVVVVQAETNERGTFLGMRDAAGREYAGTKDDVELLGPSHP